MYLWFFSFWYSKSKFFHVITSHGLHNYHCNCTKCSGGCIGRFAVWRTELPLPPLCQHGADQRCAPGPADAPPSLVTVFMRVALRPAPPRTASSGLMGKYPVVLQFLNEASSWWLKNSIQLLSLDHHISSSQVWKLGILGTDQAQSFCISTFGISQYLDSLSLPVLQLFPSCLFRKEIAFGNFERIAEEVSGV